MQRVVEDVYQDLYIGQKMTVCGHVVVCSELERLSKHVAVVQ